MTPVQALSDEFAIVAVDVVGTSRVSTIRFLYPYESMVIGGKLDGEIARYATIDEAIIGHAALVERVRLAGS